MGAGNSSTPLLYQSSEPQDDLDSQLDRLLSNHTYKLTLYCLCSIAILVGIFGIIANVLIIITYIKMGLSTSPSINISYFAMGVSDLVTCFAAMLWAVLIIPDLDSYGLFPVVAREVVVPVAMTPSLAFPKATAFITAWVALERCLCVVYPLKVKAWITRRRTVAVIAIIYVITVAPILLFNIIYRYEWKTSDIFPNKTVLGVRHVRTPVVDILYNALLVLYGLLYQWIPIISISICTSFLIIHLRQHAKWRHSIGRRFVPMESSAGPTSGVEAHGHKENQNTISEIESVDNQEWPTKSFDRPNLKPIDTSTPIDNQKRKTQEVSGAAVFLDPKSITTSTGIEFLDPKSRPTSTAIDLPPRKPSEASTQVKEQSFATMAESSVITAIAEVVNEPDVRKIQERRIIKAVLLVAIFSIIFSTPASIIILACIAIPGLRPLGQYERLSEVLTFSVSILMMFNACFNIFIYYKLGTRFRKTLKRALRIKDLTETTYGSAT